MRVAAAGLARSWADAVVGSPTTAGNYWGVERLGEDRQLVEDDRVQVDQVAPLNSDRKPEKKSVNGQEKNIDTGSSGI